MERPWTITRPGRGMRITLAAPLVPPAARWVGLPLSSLPIEGTLSVLDRIVARILTPRTAVSAHCDVPCGIYDPSEAQLSAKTVKAMFDKYAAVQGDDDAALNSKVRMITTKEKHADDCKRHLLVLWTDYFKQPHLDQYPDLSMKIKTACGTASKCKQEMDPANADLLIQQVDEIAEIFWATKKA
jgi:nickel superoxide dismutase